MAFNINAHVILSGPKNIKAVTKRIQKQLGTVNARINLVAPKNLNKQIGSFNKGLQRLNKNIIKLQSSATAANSHLQKLGNQLRTLSKTSTQLSKSQASVQKSLAKTGQNVNEARNEIQAFGKDAALAIRRFAAFTVATGVVFGFVRAIQSATKAAIDYEREIVKIVQVTGASAGKIKELSGTIQQLSVSLGVDANELAELGRIFAQTGQTIDQVGDSIRAVARSSLAPSFGEMKNTAEGLIAAMAQFNIAASRSEEVLAGLNAVSKKWAVEAEDMISVIRRAGGVFSAAAGPMSDPVDSLNELIGIFTAVRSTTRETADTIAVGLRTIFTRIQRRGTIDFLKQFNIELVNAQGNFIGLFPAFQELSRGLSDIIKKGDALTLSAITEELGGVRQVGKLIPAITQFNKALAATKVAGEAAAEGLGKDVALALQPLGKQFELLQQRFNALIRDITQSKTFQNMAKVALSMANAFLSVAETLKPLIPLLTTFAAIKISKGLTDFGIGFIGGLRKGGGAAGAGGALGGVVTGGGGGGASGSAARSVSVQQALTTAIKSHATLLASNNAALKQLGSQVISNTTAINAAGGKVATSSTQMIGSMGNLINALNRASLGGFGGGGGGRRRGGIRKFASGGYVSGPSHSQGGVPAVLEGGEYVIPKTQYHAGKKAGQVTKPKTRRKKAATGNPYLDIDPNRRNNSLVMVVRDEGNPADVIPTRISINKPGDLASKTKADLKAAGVKQFGFSAPLKISGFARSDKVKAEETAILKQVDTSITELQKEAGKAGGMGKGNLNDNRKSIKKSFNLGFGRIFEEFVNSVGGVNSGGGNNFDIQPNEGKGLTKHTTAQVQAKERGEIKLSNNAALQSDVIKKAVNQKLFAGVINRRLTKSRKSQPKSRGGIVYMQAGGLIGDNRVGAAILENIGSLTSSIKVSPADVNLQGKSTAGFPKDKRIGPSFLKGPKAYRFTKQGLRGQRSREFKKTLMTNLRGAAERSAQGLGSDLGLNTVVPDDVISQFENSINPGAIGGLFEDTIRVLNGPPFNTDTGSPFDFSTGLAAGLQDDFNDLTMTYVDAKKSKAKATDTAFKTKISSQLAREAITSGGLIPETAGQKKTRVSAGYAMKKGATTYSATGGIASTGNVQYLQDGSGTDKSGSIFTPKGTDKVPAMLTEGEFVINKKSAQKIGYGNLGKMNRYAEGGVVQYLQGGGKTAAGGMGGDVGGGALSLVFGIQMAVGALAGFTAALSGFDLKAPMTSFMALGMAAMQAVGAFTLLTPGLKSAKDATGGMAKAMGVLKQPFADLVKPLTDAGKAAKMEFVATRKGKTKLEQFFLQDKSKLTKGGALDKRFGPNKAFLEAQSKGTVGGLTGVGRPDFRSPANRVFSKAATDAAKIGPALRNGVGAFLTKIGGAGGLLSVVKSAFTGIPGLLAAVLVGPIVGAIGNAVAKSVFGKKQQIKGTNIEGRARGSGRVAGALEASGGAVGTGIAVAAGLPLALGAVGAGLTALSVAVPPLGVAIAAVTAVAVAATVAFKLAEGAIVGMAKQAEFVAFKEMAKSVKDATETMKRFNNAEIIGAASLGKMNDSLDKVSGRFDTISKASFEREKAELVGGGGGRFVRRPAAGAAIGVAAGAGIGAMVAALSIKFGILASVIGPWGTLAGAITGLVIGLGVGLYSAVFTAGKRVKALAKSFDKAAMSITPEFLEELEKSFERTTRTIIDHIAVMDEGVLQEMATVQTANPEDDPATQTDQVVSGYQEMGKALDRASGTVGEFVKELDRLTAAKFKFTFIKIIQDEANLLDEDGGNALKAAFQGIRGGLDRAVKEALEPAGDLREVFSLIQSMDIDDVTKQELKDRAVALVAEATERRKAIAVQKIAEMAAMRSRKALDALAAGLDQFANKMSSITNKFGNMTSVLQQEFSQITGERSVGKLNQINPFSKENLANASDVEIDASISQLKGLGGVAEGDKAFKEMAGLIKGQRDFPRVMRDVSAELQGMAATADEAGSN